MRVISALGERDDVLLLVLALVYQRIIRYDFPRKVPPGGVGALRLYWTVEESPKVTTQGLRHQGTKEVMEYKSLSEREEETAKAIVEAAVTTQPLRHQGTKKAMGYKSLSEREEEIAKAIVEAAVTTQPLRHQGTKKAMGYKPLSKRQFASL